MHSEVTWFDCLIYRLTARRWNKRISAVLCRHYSEHDRDSAALSSRQLHILAAEFDPTHRPTVRPRVYGTEP